MTSLSPSSVTNSSQSQAWRIAVVVITLNEELNLARCLRSLPWASEWIVLDDNSQDRTLAIAKEFGAKVYSEPWRGFGPQKHRAVELASCDWVLCLDADEEVSPELSEWLQKKGPTLNPEVAYQIPRLSRYLGRWIKHGGWYPDAQVRLFHRKYAQWSDDKIHEKVIAKKIERIKPHLRHYVFRDIAHHLQTNNRYSTLQAQQAVEKGIHFSWWKFLLKPWVKFFECYIFKAGFLDGWVGFFIAINAGISVRWRWAKIRELTELSQKEK